MNRPTIFVNVAMSLDGKLDTIARKGITLSSAADKARVDRLRAGMDAVIIGGKTLIKEDPKLTVKSLALRSERKAMGLDENPAKVGLISLADLNPEGDFLTAGPARRLIYTTHRTTRQQIQRLEDAGAEVTVLGDEKVDVSAAMESLHANGFLKVLVEGGGTILAEFFRLDLVDEVMVYVAPLIFGGANAPTLADGPGFQEGQFPRLHLGTADEFDESGGVFLHYLVEHKF